MNHSTKPALVAILVFILSCSYAQGQPSGRVNGTPIDQAELETRVTGHMSVMRERSSPGDPDEAGIREEIWNQMVDELLIQQAADRLNIRIGDAQLRQLLLDEPPEFMREVFSDSTGMFRREVYMQFIDNPEAFLLQYGLQPESEQYQTTLRQLALFREQFRRDQIRRAVERSVTSTVAITPAEALAEYRRQRSRASGSFAVLRASLISDAEAAISESEALAWFDAHRSEFKRNASREIRYAIFSPNMSREDSSAAESRLVEERKAMAAVRARKAREAIYRRWAEENGPGSWSSESTISLDELPRTLQPLLRDARAGAIIGPLWLDDGMHLIEVAAIDNGAAYVSAQHILLTTLKGGNDDSIKALAERIYKRARSGESFEELARLYSGDPSSATKGGDLGYFRKGAMVEPFDRASFAAKPGTIIGPVRTEFGYHIIKVNDRGSKSFRLNDWKISPGISDAARQALRRRVEGFRHALTPGSSIDSVGRREEMEVLESGPVRRNDPVAGSMKLGIFTWGNPVGAVSDVIELGDGSFVIAQVTKINDAGPMQFADVRETIIERLRTRRKIEMLSGDATIFRAWLSSSGQSVEDLKQIDPRPEIYRFEALSPFTPFPGVGIDSTLADAVFGMKPGEISQPIRGDHGCYIVQITRLEIPTETEFAPDRDTFIQQVIDYRRAQTFGEWMAARREEAVIEGWPGE